MQMQFISLMSSVVRRTAAVFSKDLWTMVARLQGLCFFFLGFCILTEFDMGGLGLEATLVWN